MPIATGTAEVQRSPDDPDAVTLLVNGVPSSHLDLADPERLEFEYMQQMAAVLAHVPVPGGPFRAVHLGAAGCALAR
ncbi:spermidine synthase, partial [Cellulomonas hominis]|nr:spermidine synthase [Cellulomonas hominis]